MSKPITKKKKIIIAVAAVLGVLLVVAGIIAGVKLAGSERQVDSGREIPNDTAVEYKVIRDDKSLSCAYRNHIESPGFFEKNAQYGEERLMKLANLYGMNDETKAQLKAEPSRFAVYTMNIFVRNNTDKDKCAFGVNELSALPKGIWISGDKTSTVLKIEANNGGTWTLDFVVDTSAYATDEDIAAAIESLDLSLEFSEVPPIDEAGEYEMIQRYESKVIFE